MKTIAGGVAIGVLLFTGNAQAQFAPVGSEFQVHTYTTSEQRHSSIAMDSDGDFVITWQSYGQEGFSYGVYAQRYNALGVAQASEFLVNTYTTSEQRYSSIAMDSDGDFVITWESNFQDGFYSGVYAQRYNALGVAQGVEFQVNTFTASYQSNPSIAMDSDGDFVITWHSSGQDGSGHGVYAQRYNALGVAQGSEFLVNTYTTSEQRYSSIAMDSDGDFVITWESADQDGSGNGIYARRYNALGVAQGSDFQVNTYTASHQSNPSIAMDSDGDFVITWHSSGQDGSGYGIYAQLYDALGVAQGSEFLVNTYTTSEQKYSSIAMDNAGDFVVTWESYSQDGSVLGIYAQRYNVLGIAQGVEFQVNTYTTNKQRYPSMAMDSDGDFVIAWQSYGQEGSDSGIYAQSYNGGFVTALENTTEELTLAFLYPNPARNIVAIDLEGSIAIKVKDASGKMMLETTTESGSFNAGALPAGLYFVTLSSGDSEVTKKLVIE